MKQNEQIPMIKTHLLDTRRQAIERAVEECGGEKNKDTTAVGTASHQQSKAEIADGPIRGVLVLIAEKAAGRGFDEGVRYMESMLRTQPKNES